MLKQLYATLRLYTNFFQPTMKLKSKERFGSRVKKSYRAPQTPYQRVLACAEVAAVDKKKLQRQYRLLNPAALKRELDKQCFVWRPRNGRSKMRVWHSLYSAQGSTVLVLRLGTLKHRTGSGVTLDPVR